jgi:peptide/nickel transport system permease protein
MKRSASPGPGKSAVIKNLFMKKPLAAAGLVFLLLMFIIAVFANVLAPYKMAGGALPNDILHALEKPYFLLSPDEQAAARASGDVFILGTDNLGMDILSYLIYGAYTSVVLCLGVTFLSTLISVAIGASSAVIGRWYDLIVQRIVDAWQCIPGLLITVLMMSMFGNGILQMILVMSIPGGIAGSRMVRSAAISVKDSGYVKMSEMMGSGVLWKTIRHVLPNIMPIILTFAAGGLGGVIMMEASLNFLGYGVDVGTPSWGYMISHQGRANMYAAPWLILYPGILIMLMVLAANLFGDGLRDVLDPRLKGGVGSYNSKKIREIYQKYLKKLERKRTRGRKAPEKE